MFEIPAIIVTIGAALAFLALVAALIGMVTVVWLARRNDIKRDG